MDDYQVVTKEAHEASVDNVVASVLDALKRHSGGFKSTHEQQDELLLKLLDLGRRHRASHGTSTIGHDYYWRRLCSQKNAIQHFSIASELT